MAELVGVGVSLEYGLEFREEVSWMELSTNGPKAELASGCSIA